MEMTLGKWIDSNGSSALKRAYAEGYAVKKGIGDQLVSELRQSVRMPVLDSWDAVEERTSPTADSFAKRDLMQTLVNALKVPDGWQVDVSRVSRIETVDAAIFTGVLLSVLDAEHKIVRQAVVNFEHIGQP